MPEGLCDQCGKKLEVSRRGGMRKRFCSHACRNAFHNGKNSLGKAKQAGISGRISPERRLADLENAYELLVAEVEAEGAGAKGAIDRMLKLSVEIGRMTAAPPDEGEELDVLRAVG